MSLPTVAPLHNNCNNNNGTCITYLAYFSLKIITVEPVIYGHWKLRLKIDHKCELSAQQSDRKWQVLLRCWLHKISS